MHTPNKSFASFIAALQSVLVKYVTSSENTVWATTFTQALQNNIEEQQVLTYSSYQISIVNLEKAWGDLPGGPIIETA